MKAIPYVSFNGDCEEAVYAIVKKLADGGRITMPAEKTFWNSVYGSLVDKFGVPWGIEFAIRD